MNAHQQKILFRRKLHELIIANAFSDLKRGLSYLRVIEFPSFTFPCGTLIVLDEGEGRIEHIVLDLRENKIISDKGWLSKAQLSNINAQLEGIQIPINLDSAEGLGRDGSELIMEMGNVGMHSCQFSWFNCDTPPSFAPLDTLVSSVRQILQSADFNPDTSQSDLNLTIEEDSGAVFWEMDS